jgi:hypothetical protein
MFSKPWEHCDTWFGGSVAALACASRPLASSPPGTQLRLRVVAGRKVLSRTITRLSNAGRVTVIVGGSRSHPIACIG